MRDVAEFLPLSVHKFIATRGWPVVEWAGSVGVKTLRLERLIIWSGTGPFGSDWNEKFQHMCLWFLLCS